MGRVVIVVVVILFTYATAHAKPKVCTSKATCEAACLAGDPVACIVGEETPLTPLASDKFSPETWSICEYACERHAAHLWAGVGTKPDRESAIDMWRRACSDNHVPACVAYAIVIAKDDGARARELLEDTCHRFDDDLACRAGGQMWTRVYEKIGSRKFSIELPAVVRHISPWGDSQHVDWHVSWSASTMRPDIEVDTEMGELRCKAQKQSAGNPTDEELKKIVARYAAKYDRLPAGWEARICKSVREEK